MGKWGTMDRATLLGVIAAGLGLVPVRAKGAQEESSRSNSASSRLSGALDDLLGMSVKEAGIPGLALVVIDKHERVVYQRYLGEYGADGVNSVDEHALFAIGSMTKTLTATAVLRLCMSGKLGLDDVIGPFYESAPTWKQIRIRNLLDHSSGIPDVLRAPAMQRKSEGPHDVEPDAIIRSLQGLPLDAPSDVGSFEYSNSNYLVLADVVKRVTGESFAAAVTNLVLRAQGLESSIRPITATDASTTIVGFDGGPGVRQPDLVVGYHWLEGAGNYASTALAYSVFGARLFSGHILDAKYLTAMTTRNHASPYGLGVFVDDTPVRRYFHSGSVPGFGSQYTYLPAGGMSVTLLSNAETTEVAALSQAIAAMLLNWA